jgi:gamma-glutamylcyclotransferase (GGCT)/AIG2-like uncharacterized protein YtfP
MAAMNHRLFVYGTLRSGQTNCRRLGEATPLGPARAGPGFALVDFGWHPAMVAEGAGYVVGEVFLVDDATLDRLDEFEDCPRWFQRVRVPLVAHDGAPLPTADAYVMSTVDHGRPRIAGGDWCRRGG